MKIPPGHTEATVLAAIEKAVNILAPSFVFGYYQLDDIRQQGRLFALEALERGGYKPHLPLENFLYTHVRNRLLNLQRDKLRRNEPPCPACHSGTPCGVGGSHCKRYSLWLKRNQAKASVLKPLDLDHIADEKERRTRVESTVVQDAEMAEILERIDEQLPVELRGDYLKMREGASVPKARRLLVEDAVKTIFRGALGCPSNEDD